MYRGLACLVFLVLLAALPLAVGAPGEKKGAPKLQLSEDEKTLLELTTKERAREKLPPLLADPTLCKVARAHSANMAKKGDIGHVLDGKNPADRVQDAGYDYAKVGENIGVSEKGAPVEDAVKGWMDSPPHRQNILHPRFREIGVGIVRDDKGDIYYTQVFAIPRKRR
jgi:uncharacterized protein YkwD